MTEILLNWPKKGDMPFRPSFPLPNRGLLDAFVMPSTDSYVEGFKRVGDIVVANFHRDGLNPDNLFFPIAYVYRHHLELLMKELIRLGERAGIIDRNSASQLEPCPACGRRQMQKDWRTEHSLQKLWANVRGILKSMWPGSQGDDLQAVENVIIRFHNLDPSGQAFRYAHQTNGAPNLQDAPERVDLENLGAVVDAVSIFLYAACAAIDNYDPGDF